MQKGDLKGEAKMVSYCILAFCEYWSLQRKYSTFQYSTFQYSTFKDDFLIFFPLSERRYWDKLPLRHLLQWFLSASLPNRSTSGLCTQVPEGNSTLSHRSLLRVLNYLLRDCFLASLPITYNAKHWKSLEEYCHTHSESGKAFFTVSDLLPHDSS